MATKAVTTFSFQKMGHERNYAEFRLIVENGLELHRSMRNKAVGIACQLCYLNMAFEAF